MIRHNGTCKTWPLPLCSVSVAYNFMIQYKIQHFNNKINTKIQHFYRAIFTECSMALYHMFLELVSVADKGKV